MDIFDSQKRSQIMRSIPNKNTKPELIMRKALHAMGLRYRLNDRAILGTPDIVFKKQKTVVFVDGDWWHGRNYAAEQHKYPERWQKKIKANMERDLAVNQGLKLAGWKVFRFWQKELEKEPTKFAKEVYNYIVSVR